jgi:hypothetical protein
MLIYFKAPLVVKMHDYIVTIVNKFTFSAALNLDPHSACFCGKNRKQSAGWRRKTHCRAMWSCGSLRITPQPTGWDHCHNCYHTFAKWRTKIELNCAWYNLWPYWLISTIINNVNFYQSNLKSIYVTYFSCLSRYIKKSVYATFKSTWDEVKNSIYSLMRSGC